MDICYRLPLLGAQVEALELPVWKARKVAQLTYHLGVEACGFVDSELAGRVRGFGLVTIENITAIAIARFHPELLPDAEQVARAGWDVSLDHATVQEFAGTSTLTASGDTLGFTRFYELVCTVATALGRLGETDTFNQRKATAIGIIADPEELLALLERAENLPEEPADTTSDTTSDTGPDTSLETKVDGGTRPAGGATPEGAPETEAGTERTSQTPAAGRRRTRRVAGTLRKPAKVRLYAHISATALESWAAAAGEPVVIGHVERLGPATLDKLREWLATSGATITPVIDPVVDLNRTDALDAYQPPAWMRELVILRDQHCVFPWCARDARTCDLDHIEAYIHASNGNRAPPGQTRPDNLAPLCRMHHLAKTFYRWSYHRLPNGSYRWKDPHGNTYIIDTNGTRHLDTE